MKKTNPIKSTFSKSKKVKKIDLKKIIKEKGICPIDPNELPIFW